MKQIRAQIDETTSDYDREKLQERLAKLVGGVAVIRVGAATEIEMKEKKARVEDALNATRAAVEEGIVPGGGVALLRCAPALDAMKLKSHDEELGVKIIKRALEEPIRQIANNAGFEGSVVAEHVKNEKGGIRLQRRNRRLRRPAGRGRHRPHQGDPLRHPERRLGGRPAHHHRSHDRRETQEGSPDAPHGRRRHGRHGRDVLRDGEARRFWGRGPGLSQARPFAPLYKNPKPPSPNPISKNRRGGPVGRPFYFSVSKDVILRV